MSNSANQATSVWSGGVLTMAHALRGCFFRCYCYCFVVVVVVVVLSLESCAYFPPGQTIFFRHPFAPSPQYTPYPSTENARPSFTATSTYVWAPSTDELLRLLPSPHLPLPAAKHRMPRDGFERWSLVEGWKRCRWVASLYWGANFCLVVACAENASPSPPPRPTTAKLQSKVCPALISLFSFPSSHFLCLVILPVWINHSSLTSLIISGYTNSFKL